ncbi:MAG: TIGR00725 family protein, partial [Anaerolineales bacterium]
MKSVRLVSVIGSAQCSSSEARFAEEVGRLIAKEGMGIVCGGRGGVMEAVCRGAWDAGGFTLGLLPSTHAGDANAFLSVAIPTGMNEARNVLVVLAGEIVLAIGGG